MYNNTYIYIYVYMYYVIRSISCLGIVTQYSIVDDIA